MSLGILGMRHDLFKTAPTSYPINFVAGDVFDPDTPFDEPVAPLAGGCVEIHASSFFICFQQRSRTYVASALAGLLSPEPETWTALWDVKGFTKGKVQVETEMRNVEEFQHLWMK